MRTMDGADLKVKALHGAKSALDLAEHFVASHYVVGSAGVPRAR